MNSRTRRALGHLYDLTNEACARCVPEPLRCCRPAFCRAAAAGLLAVHRSTCNAELEHPHGDRCEKIPGHGGEHEGIHCVAECSHPTHPTLPFMGPRGCVLVPEERPLCTLYACENQPHTQEREFKRRLEDARAKAFSDPEVAKMAEVARASLLSDPEIASGLEGARERCMKLMGGPAD